MKKLFLILLVVIIGCKNSDNEYERGWYNACYYVSWKSNHQAELPCVALKDFTREHPEINSSNADSLFNARIFCGDHPYHDLDSLIQGRGDTAGWGDNSGRSYWDSSINNKSVLSGLISVGTSDTAFATWLGPDSVMFVLGHGMFRDTTTITNPTHKYNK